jgi:hypothetical protein
MFSLYATVVFADEVPEGCTGVYEEPAYVSGETSGENIVDFAWAKINNCEMIEVFESFVLNLIDRFELPESSSTTTACRYSGYMTGAMAAISDIYQSCTGLCYEEGRIIGKMMGIAYCELSLVLGGLPLVDDFFLAPVTVCGEEFSNGCEDAFTVTTHSYSNDMGACIWYTEDEYYEVWQQCLEKQCLSVPSVPSVQPVLP